MAGIIANDPEETIYLNTTTDAKGDRLDGLAVRSEVRKGGLPEVSEFWSLTMYDMTFNFAKTRLIATPLEASRKTTAR